MRILSILIAFLLSAYSGHSQNQEYFPGYVVKNNGDTLFGQLADRSFGSYQTLYSRIRFIEEGSRKRKKFSADQIQAYKIADRYFESFPLWEDAAFLRFKYYLDRPVPNVFLKVIKKSKFLYHYEQEYVHDDNFYLDSFPLFYKPGSNQMVRVTQGILGLKFKNLKEYFYDCPSLVDKLEKKHLREIDEVYNFYLDKCIWSHQ